MVTDGKIRPVRINRTPLFDLVDVEAFEQLTRSGTSAALLTKPTAPAEPAIQILKPLRLGPRVTPTWYSIALTLLWRDFCRLSARSGRHATGHWRDRE
jgi:hypothetical protein